MFLSCTYMTKMSHLLPEDLHQCLPKVRADTKNFQAMESRDKWTKINNEQADRNLWQSQITMSSALFLFCCSASQINELVGTGKPFLLACVQV